MDKTHVDIGASSRTYRLGTSTGARLFAGTVALAISGATLMLFGPFSELTSRQLAAGPAGAHLPQGGREALMVRTGRDWRAQEVARMEAAASAARLIGRRTALAEPLSNLPAVRPAPR